MYRSFLLALALALTHSTASGQNADPFQAHTDLLQSLEDSVGQCGSSNPEINHAVAALRKALSPALWATHANVPDPLLGSPIFEEDAEAAGALDVVVNASGRCSGLASEVLQELYATDLHLVNAAATEAQSGAGCDTAHCQSDLQLSRAASARADSAKSDGNWQQAVSQLGTSWTLAISAAGQRSKMTICHIPPGNPANRRTITVSTRSLEAHFGNHGDYFGACSFEGSGSADLGLAATTDDPLAPRGKAVKSTVKVRNSGPDDATNMVVNLKLPANTYQAAATSGDSEFDLASGDWKIPYIESDTEIELILDGVATDELPTVSADMTVSDQTDENPDNDSGGLASRGSSSGGDGGLESNGGLAAKIAAREFARAQDRILGRAKPPLLRFNTASKQSGLGQFVPGAFPGAASTVITTPADLVSVTNATDALAVDWLSASGATVGAMMVFETPPGSVYEHTKVICDRLVGAKLERVRMLRIEGQELVMVALRHENGMIDYAISLAVYDMGSSWALESRFRNAEYSPPPGVPVVNLQIWSSSPSATANLVGQILGELGHSRHVASTGAALEPPAVIARSAEYRAGFIHMELDNRAAPGVLALTGTIRAAEHATAEPFRESLNLGRGLNTVSLPVGPAYDMGFTLDTGSAGARDEVYLSDGAWGAVADAGSEVDRFETSPSASTLAGLVERSVSLRGSVRTWIAAFRFLRAGGMPVDRSATSLLRIEGASSHPLRVSVAFLDELGKAEAKEFSADLTAGFADIDLALEVGDWLSRLTQVTFFLDGNGLNAEPASLDINSIRFLSGSVSTSTDSPPDEGDVIARRRPFPNPFTHAVSVPVDYSLGAEISGSVYDVLGRRVFDIPATSNMQRLIVIDGGALRPGAYLVRLTDGQTSQTHTILRAR